MTKRALLIGINAYPRLGDLRYAARDAEAVGEVLTQHYGFAPSNVMLMTCKASGIWHATQNNIEEQLTRLREIDDIELLVVGFWGHGISVPGGTDCRRYLCAVDTSDQRLERTGISLVALREYVEQTGAANTCLILDCCQNHAVGRSATQLSLSPADRDFMSNGARDIVAAMRMEGIKSAVRKAAVLNSCSFGERAYEWQERKHGIFTAHLLDAMQQSDSVTDWIEYIQPRVYETARNMGQSQKPFASFEGGDIRFAAAESFAKKELLPVVSVQRTKSNVTVQQAVKSPTHVLMSSVITIEHALILKHTNKVRAVAFSPDDKKVVTGGYKSARTWDAKTGELLLKLEGNGLLRFLNWFAGHAGSSSVVFSHDGKRVITGTGPYRGAVRIWDAETGKILKKLKGHTAWVGSVAFSSNGKKVVTGSFDNTARIWDAVSGKELNKLQGHTGTVLSVAFSPDSTKVVTGSFDKTARIWDVETGQELKRLQGHNSCSAAFSPNGKKVITCECYTARIWDAGSGKELKNLAGHTNYYVNSVAFSPDGKKLVAGSSKGVTWGSLEEAVRILDAESGELLQVLKGHTDDVLSVAFSSDGRKVLTGSSDNTARIWNLE